MTYRDLIETLLDLDGTPISLDIEIPRLEVGGRVISHQEAAAGVIRLRELPFPDDSQPADEMAWWSKARENAVLELQPGGGTLLRAASFLDAHWDGDDLIIELAWCRMRLVPLVRPDGKAVELKSPDSRCDSARRAERERLLAG